MPERSNGTVLKTVEPLRVPRVRIPASPPTKKSTIGENIKKYRNKLGISQDILSKRANLAFHTIAKIEAGSTPNPTIDTVKKIADALGVTLDDLMK